MNFMQQQLILRKCFTLEKLFKNQNFVFKNKTIFKNIFVFQSNNIISQQFFSFKQRAVIQSILQIVISLTYQVLEAPWSEFQRLFNSNVISIIFQTLYIFILKILLQQISNMQVEKNDYEHCQYANDYKLHFLLGQGGQASVYLGSKGKFLYAVKVYAQGLNKDQAFKREVDFLKNLKFDYLINIVDEDAQADVKLKNNKPQKRAIIVLQFAEAQMFDFISRQGRFTPEVCRTLFKQLIASIKFLDDRGITHRDLKPQNILFDSNFNLKVSDFGLSTFSEGHDKDGVLYSRVGTEGYKPPEMELGKYTGLQADIFAAGVILFVMYNGTPPFMSTKPIDKIYKLIKDKNYAKFWSLHQKKKPIGFYPDSFKRLLNEFFTADPTKRPTFASLQQDQWLNGDCVLGNQLKQYMQKRYDKIAQQDELKKKIAQVRKQMFMNEIMQDQNCQSNKTTRGQAVQVFIETRNQFKNIKVEQLQTTQKKLTFLSKDIGFVLAFLKDFVGQCYKNKNIFIEDFLQDIQPSKYDMTVDGNEINLKFIFDIDEQQQEILKINGKLCCNGNGCVGIEWNKVSGNDFWLSKIIKELDQRLQVLA